MAGVENVVFKFSSDLQFPGSDREPGAGRPGIGGCPELRALRGCALKPDADDGGHQAWAAGGELPPYLQGAQVVTMCTPTQTHCVHALRHRASPGKPSRPASPVFCQEPRRTVFGARVTLGSFNKVACAQARAAEVVSYHLREKPRSWRWGGQPANRNCFVDEIFPKNSSPSSA